MCIRDSARTDVLPVRGQNIVEIVDDFEADENPFHRQYLRFWEGYIMFFRTLWGAKRDSDGRKRGGEPVCCPGGNPFDS